MPGSRVVLVLLALVVPVAGVLVAFAFLPGAAPPDSATNSGDAINQVYWVVLGMAAVVFVLVEATLLTFIVRFRRRGGAPGDVEGPQIHGNTRVEIIWTAIPALLLLGLAIFTFLQIPDVEATPEPGEDVLVVNVTAHQFYWQYEYPGGALSFDTLYLPVDRPVTLVIRSEDVDHSWWVPELTGKRDAIPGKTNELNFTPNRTGVFENGVCGEFCGIQHTRMTTRVVVLGTSRLPDLPLPERAGRRRRRARGARRAGVDGRHAPSATASRARAGSARRSRGTAPSGIPRLSRTS